MTKMAAIPINSKNPSKFFSGTTGPISTLHDASGTEGLQCVYKSLPLDDLDRFYGKVNIGRPCIRLGKFVKLSFERRNLQKMCKWTDDI